MKLSHYSKRTENYCVGPIEDYVGPVSSFSRNDYRALIIPRYFCYCDGSELEPIVTDGRNLFETTIRGMDILTLDYDKIRQEIKENRWSFQQWHENQSTKNPNIRGYRYLADGLKIACVFKGSLDFIKK